MAFWRASRGCRSSLLTLSASCFSCVAAAFSENNAIAVLDGYPISVTVTKVVHVVICVCTGSGSSAQKDSFGQAGPFEAPNGQGSHQPANHGAYHTAGEDILPGQVQAWDIRFWPQPALLKAFRGVVQAIEFTLLVTAEPGRREWCGGFHIVHLAPELGQLLIHHLQQLVGDPGFHCL